MSFKDQALADLNNVFFNLEEFGELHTIGDSDQVPSIIDTDVSQPLDSAKVRFKGAYNDRILLYVRQSDLPFRPDYDAVFPVDDVEYQVKNVNSYLGIWELTLEAKV